jgi:DNA-binding CsgD family transcriptional regulator
MEFHRSGDAGGLPVSATTDFSRLLELKLVKRRLWALHKLLAWGELLDAAGWCVALRVSEDECWLGKRARHALVLPSMPVRWDELLARLDAVPPESFRIKDGEVLVWAAEAEGLAPAPDTPLTRREGEVLFWLQQGKTAPEMATILGCALRTVEKHVANLYRKIGAHDRASIILGRKEVP